MFRDRSTPYESVTNALQSIGDRLHDLETQLAERLDPTPSRSERFRRAIARSNPFHSEPTGLSRYLPDFLVGWQAPTSADARRQLAALRDSAEDGFDGARHYLSHISERLPELRLPRRTSFRRGMQAQRGVDRLRDRPEFAALLVAGSAVALVGAAWYVTKKVQEHSEEPDYDTVREDGAVEIRDYEPMLVAETVKSGYHEKARRIGFQTLADYIFAKNRSGKKIAMTTPVLQQLAEGDGRMKGWAIRFVMPKKFTKMTLPQPGTSDVTIREVPARRMASIRFSGNFSATLASRQLMTLYNYLADQNLKQKGDPEYAFYNPPWTPGFLKRNEILIEIER